MRDVLRDALGARALKLRRTLMGCPCKKQLPPPKPPRKR